jgi:enoyl-CoA hydratase/carnithine racemase
MNAPNPESSHDASSILRRDLIDKVCILTFNRPQARNCLSESLITALHGALAKAAVETRIHAVVLAAEGPAFCAGHDLKELTLYRGHADGGRSHFHKIMTDCSAMMQQIVTMPKPVIAAVQGMATAAGCQLVACCDLAIAADTARFATPGVNIGLFCSTPMVALTRNLSRKHAMEMLLTGDAIDAPTAASWGLINRVVPAGSERDAAIELAQKISAKSAKTIKIGKEAFYRQAEMTLADAYRYAAEVMTENMLTHDAREGIEAFIDKRPPEWRNQ